MKLLHHDLILLARHRQRGLILQYRPHDKVPMSTRVRPQHRQLQHGIHGELESRTACSLGHIFVIPHESHAPAEGVPELFSSS